MTTPENSPEKERVVAIVEDDEYMWVDLLERMSRNAGARVALVITTFADAINPAKVLEMIEAGVTDILLDGNLTPKSVGGEDGRQAAKIYKDAMPNVNLIGISTEHQGYVDRHIGKGGELQEKLKLALLGSVSSRSEE